MNKYKLQFAIKLKPQCKGVFFFPRKESDGKVGQ